MLSTVIGNTLNLKPKRPYLVDTFKVDVFTISVLFDRIKVLFSAACLRWNCVKHHWKK